MERRDAGECFEKLQSEGSGALRWGQIITPIKRRELSMRTITIALPDQPLGDVEMTDDELTEEIRMLAAVKLYELGRISSGRAAEFAGISRVEFINELGRYNVSPFQITPEELKTEVKGLRADLGQ